MPDQSKTMASFILEALKATNDAGLTASAIKELIKRNAPQWKVSSVSPALSTLEDAGCIRVDYSTGERHCFYLREPKKSAGKRYHNNSKESPLRLMLAIGENKTEILTPAEARALYDQLRQIFKGGK